MRAPSALLLTMLLPTAALASAQPVRRAVLSNTLPRYDVNGAIVNAKSGSLYRFNGTFYLYGTAYPACEQRGAICEQSCGYYNNTFAVYASPDMMAWTLLSANLVPQINGDAAHIEYDEVNVGYCAERGDFVLLFWSGHFGFRGNSLAIARAPTPAGPFTLAPPLVAAGAQIISDTVSLFVDDDGTAYVRYNTRDLPFRHVVERLSRDWSRVTGEFAVIFAKPTFPWFDGGGMFRRGDIYYVMLSFDCCFCSWGSDALVFVAPSPLGPWAPQSRAALAALRQRARGAPCNLTGVWEGSLGGKPPGPPTVSLFHAASNAVTASGAVATAGVFYPANNSLVFPAFPGFAADPLVGALGAFNGSSDACSQLTWLRGDIPGGNYWCAAGACGPQPNPPAARPNEVNFCADGRQPPETVADMTINPCSQGDVNGVNFTVPAQQFAVATLANASGGAPALLYIGERFRSSPWGLKNSDFSYWAPLGFDADGAVQRMSFVDSYELVL